MGNFEEDKIWTENEEARRQESVENQFPPIQVGEEIDFRTAISRDFGNGGGQITLPEQKETNTGEKALGNV